MKELKNQALQLKREKKYDQAFAIFEEILEKFPTTNPDFCLSNMAHLQYLKGNYPKALQLAQTALQHNPKNWFSLSILGEIALKQNQPEGALQFFEEAYHINPADLYLTTRLAKIFQQQNQLEKAFSLLGKALLEQPGESRLYECLGDIYKSSGNPEKARENYLKAIELKNDNPYAFRQWIATMEQEKSKNEILAEIQKLMKLPSQKNNPFLQEYYGQLLRQAGRTDEAVKHLENSILADPRNLFRKTRLAANYNQLQKYQDVVALLEPEYKNGVIDLYVFQELGKAYIGLNKNQEARELLIRGLKAFPNAKYLRMLLMSNR